MMIHFKQCISLAALALSALAAFSPKVNAAPETLQLVTKTSSSAVFQLAEGKLRIDFVTDRIARVRYTRESDWPQEQSMMRVPVDKGAGVIKIAENKNAVTLQSSQLEVRVDRASSAVSFYNKQGIRLLTENPEAPRKLESVPVIKSVADPATIQTVQTVDGERKIAGRYTTTKDRDAWSGQVSFRFDDNEALYGLGCGEENVLNRRGSQVRLYVHNLKKVNPSLVSTKGYGLLFDAYSAMTFQDGKDSGSMSFDVVDAIDYYFIDGPDMDGAVEGYRELTGAAAMLPKYAYGYVQSKERYVSQNDIVSTAKKFRDLKLPIDVIVQDWNYWPGGEWGGLRFDPGPYPDPTAMAKSVHDLNMHLMLSIWHNTSPRDPSGKQFHDLGYTLAGTDWVNVFDSKARAFYWQCVWKNLGIHGIDAWWCDSTEPEMADWGGGARPADHDVRNIAALAKVVDPELLNAYGLQSSKEIYDNSRITVPNRRVLNLTRSSYAGSQRYGAVVWSGDISAKWSVYADQVTFGQSWSATGDPYWTNDIGAFFVRKGWAWYGAGDYQKGVDDLGYRELYTRWFQFGAFLPMFRSHGTDTPREPWRFGEPGTPFYDSITDMLRLRYRLIPHIYSIAGAVTQKGSSFIRPVAFEFPNDLKTHDLKTQFLFGKEILVNPVLKPMYYGVNSTPIADAPKTSPVYLPSGAEWFDFWTGKKSNGGQTLDANAPISRIPLYVRAGSIIPLGPDQQYASEKPADPIELRIYPGANSYYSLYEDEGEGYSYEKGVYSTIPIEWNEKTQTLTIGARKGTFPGILDHRTFRIVWVGDNHGAGIAPEENADSVVNYVGHKLTVIRKK